MMVSSKTSSTRRAFRFYARFAVVKFRVVTLSSSHFSHTYSDRVLLFVVVLVVPSEFSPLDRATCFTDLFVLPQLLPLYAQTDTMGTGCYLILLVLLAR